MPDWKFMEFSKCDNKMHIILEHNQIEKGEGKTQIPKLMG